MGITGMTKKGYFTAQLQLQFDGQPGFEMPQGLTEMEIVSFVLDATQKAPVGAMKDVPEYQYLEAIFSTYCDPTNWKSPFYVVFPKGVDYQWVRAAIHWFHGVEPVQENPDIIYSPGYAA